VPSYYTTPISIFSAFRDQKSINDDWMAVQPSPKTQMVGTNVLFSPLCSLLPKLPSAGRMIFPMARASKYKSHLARQSYLLSITIFSTFLNQKQLRMEQ
jgi:hypothetical protein